jgi:hypothetical protein
MPTVFSSEAERSALHLLERLVELAEVAERETAQPRPGGLGCRHGEPPQQLLRRIAPSGCEIIQASGAQRDRLGNTDDELGLR